MIIEVKNKQKWSKVLNKLNWDYDLNNIVPSIGSNYDAWWFVAIENGKVIGTAACEHHITNPMEMFLGPCAILPSARGRGLQRQFIERREMKAISLGIKT